MREACRTKSLTGLDSINATPAYAFNASTRTALATVEPGEERGAMRARIQTT